MTQTTTPRATMSSNPPPQSGSRLVQTSKHDIFMSIKPEHITNIANRTKNHEYRRYLLPSTVQRIWFYTTAPLSRLEYVARVSRGKTRGEVPEDGGIGNKEFNAGLKISNYAYEILELWRLQEVITLKGVIKAGYLKGAPQKYSWVPVELLKTRPLERQVELFCRGEGEGGGKREREASEDKEGQGEEKPKPAALLAKKSGTISDYFLSSGR
ncbi:uncharacterized protein BDV17DRAFT_254363 [Aspergillus undulatus]|uniref:uncharacterized protein n=1 Tax=Aspergillus undulatus TaxID=1810928 RepID=UPI003CCE241C